MIFCNRTLNLKKISHIGLDMDHTLVRYHVDRFEQLAYDSMKEKLIRNFNYPEEIKKLKFDFNKAIRGLVIDKNHGNLLKVSRFGSVREAYHGLKRMNFKQQKEIFGARYIDLRSDTYDIIDTTFSISHACLYAQLVDFKNHNTKLELPDFADIAEHLHKALDLSHRDGSIKNHVIKDPEKYVKRSEGVVRGLEKFKKYDKTIFVATNSDYQYTNHILQYAIDPYIDGHPWQDFFDYTFTLTMKPRFFYSSLPLLKVDTVDGSMKNWDKKIEKGVYQGGSAQLLTDSWDILSDNLLYIGDHIYGDILRLKKDCGWRTGLILEELGEEVKQNKAAEALTHQIKEFMVKKVQLEEELNDLVAQRLERNNPSKEKEEEVHKKILELDEKLIPIIKKRAEVYNSDWGPIMRVGVEESYLAHQVEGYSDIYMAKLEDFLEASPRHYFRSFIRNSAHDE